MRLALLLGASTAFCLGYVAQNVLAVKWTSSSLSPYGILLVNCVSFPVIFGAMLAAYSCIRRNPTIFTRLTDRPGGRETNFLALGSQAQTLLLVGLFNTFNGIFIIFGSPATRTPPLIQAVLQNAGVLFSVPFSKVVLGDRKSYCSWAPLLAGALVAGSVVISILPTIIAGRSGDDINGGQSAAWCVIYLMGLLPGAGYNVMQQKYLIREGMLRAKVSAHDFTVASLRMLVHGTLWMLIFMAALFWVDLLPWFGTAAGDMTKFRQITAFSLACSFGGPAAVADAATRYPALDAPVCEPPTAGYAYGFVGGYTIAYLGGAILNRDSSTFTMLNFVLITMLTSGFWYIPGTNPNPSNTPPWSVATSLVLSLAGILLWKWWEVRVDDGTPQFDLAVAAEKELAMDDRNRGFGLRHAGWSGLGEYSDLVDGDGESEGDAGSLYFGGAYFAPISASVQAGSGGRSVNGR